MQPYLSKTSFGAPPDSNVDQQIVTSDFFISSDKPANGTFGKQQALQQNDVFELKETIPGEQLQFWRGQTAQFKDSLQLPGDVARHNPSAAEQAQSNHDEVQSSVAQSMREPLSDFIREQFYEEQDQHLQDSDLRKSLTDDFLNAEGEVGQKGLSSEEIRREVLRKI